jgi:hypothetical protein
VSILKQIKQVLQPYATFLSTVYCSRRKCQCLRMRDFVVFPVDGTPSIIIESRLPRETLTREKIANLEMIAMNGSHCEHAVPPAEGVCELYGEPRSMLCEPRP